MKFAFTQIYSEPGTSFRLAGIFLNIMQSELDLLDVAIERIQARFPSLEVTIVLIITASTTVSSVELTKPIFLRKRPEIEFAVRMPYRELQDPIERCQWVCINVFEAVSELYKRYTLSPPDMTPCIERVMQKVRTNPIACVYKH